MVEAYLVGDVGGTNTRLRIICLNGRIYNFIYETQRLSNLSESIKDVLSKIKNIEIVNSCIGVPGPVEEGKFCKSHMINWEIDRSQILKDTGLKKLFLINDFEALGWSINVLNEKNHKKLNDIKINEGGIKCLVGAGTGLGVCKLVYDENKKIYVPLSSEAGHTTLAVRNLEEFRLLNFLKNIKRGKICNKDVLSGEGLENIYRFFSGSKLNSKDVIKSENEYSIETCKLFSKFYAKFVSDMALNCLAEGGVYIAGGIAIDNPGLVSNQIFMNEFKDVCEHMKRTISRIPLFLITDSCLALDGALFYLRLQE